MKKGDLIIKTLVIEKGSVGIRGCDSEASARKFMERETGAVAFEVRGDDINPERFMGVYIVQSTLSTRAKVNWVVDKEAAITLETGESKIIDVEGEGWEVEVEAAPSYQSDVANMSEEELRTSIEELRSRRSYIPKSKVKATKAKGEKEPVDPMEKILAKLSPEKRAKLMEKMGMV